MIVSVSVVFVLLVAAAVITGAGPYALRKSRQRPKPPSWSSTVIAELIIPVAIGTAGGLIAAHPLAYWWVIWEDKLDRHHAQCTHCKQRAARRAQRQAERHG